MLLSAAIEGMLNAEILGPLVAGGGRERATLFTPLVITWAAVGLGRRDHCHVGFEWVLNDTFRLSLMYQA